MTTLYNHDTDEDTDPGRMLTKANWDVNKFGSMGVGLYDCDAAGANCTTISSGTLSTTGRGPTGSRRGL